MIVAGLSVSGRKCYAGDGSIYTNLIKVGMKKATRAGQPRTRGERLLSKFVSPIGQKALNFRLGRDITPLGNRAGSGNAQHKAMRYLHIVFQA